MNKFILEIGTEEVPSIYIDKTLKHLKKSAMKELQHLSIEYGNIYAFGTPRRFIVYIEDIKTQQKDLYNKTKGPSKTISFDREGNPQKPAIKFAQANQLKLEELVTEKTNKGEYLFAKKVIIGKKTKLLLPDICLKLISDLTFPKSMRWGKTSFRFIRPVRWLLALYNKQVIPFTLETINSDRISYGHRLLSPEPVTISDVDDYFKIMKECFVIIDPEKRKKMIHDQIMQMVRESNNKECIDEMLLDEVKNLVEYPRVLLGQFDKNYLELPSEVLKAVMIKHQKYFPAYTGDGKISPFFFVVINGNEDSHKEIIIQGNERVLKARLEDARFFYQEDQKIIDVDIKPLDRNIEKLKNVVYQENLGSMHNKVERLITLTGEMGKKLQVSSNLSQIIKRSAQICKSDLVSEMVKEFPELQGAMGKEYALLQGEDKQVAVTIWEHYLPRFSGDDLPETLSGSILSIMDKLDNIVSCFINGIIPDGSQDPYALRRQSLGILNIILHNHMNFSLDDVIDFNIEVLQNNRSFKNKINMKKESLKDIVKSFILQRFRQLLFERGYKYDMLDAVLEKRPENIFDALLRMEVIQEIYHQPKFNKIITAATRTFNLSKNSIKFKVNCTIFQEKEEKILYEQYLKTMAKIEKAVFQQNYKGAFDNLEAMTVPVDTFFDNVLVMDKDESIRNNRLALLKEITKMYYTIADLSKITLSKGNLY